jgi:poly(hydroxyalkanoate) depolymerase family esterase
LPLLVMLHGCTQGADDIAAGTRLNFLSDKLSCFVAYPSQSQAANPSRCWNWYREIDQQRDRGEPALIAGITRAVISRYPIDSTRVFVAGLSAGAAMAVTMAAAYPDLYAAVGSHSGLAYRSGRNMLGAWTAMRTGDVPVEPLSAAPIPLIAFHGENDETVNPRNSDNLIAQWLASVPSQSLPYSEVQEAGESNGRHYRRSLYQNGRGEVRIEQWLISGLGHAWSGGEAGPFADPKGPDASGEMLRFFLSLRAALKTSPSLLTAHPKVVV